MIREVGAADLETTLTAVEACGLFSAEELPTLRAQLEQTLSGRSERGEFWLAEFDGRTARGVAFCAEEVLTDRVWNLLFIGVPTELHGQGIGSALLERVESALRERGQRMLVIDTTNGPDFDGARTFYRRHGYTEEGTVRDFYEDGAHKITFRKVL